MLKNVAVAVLDTNMAKSELEKLKLKFEYQGTLREIRKSLKERTAK